MRDQSRRMGRAKRRARPRNESSASSAARTAGQDPFAATPEKMLPFVRALAEDAEKQIGRALGRPVTPAALVSAATAAHAGYDQTWRYVQSLHVVPHACRAGCDWCCYLTVETSAPEVFAIAEHLRATRTPEQRALLRASLRQTSARVQGLSPSERVQAAVPCALLESGRCSVHSVRPLACRSWNSRDASACERVLRDGGGDLRPVQDQRPFGINAGIRTGLLEALRPAGILEDPEQPCELNTGLLLALANPQAAEQWLAGVDTLAAARATVRYSDQEILA